LSDQVLGTAVQSHPDNLNLATPELLESLSKNIEKGETWALDRIIETHSNQEELNNWLTKKIIQLLHEYPKQEIAAWQEEQIPSLLWVKKTLRQRHVAELREEILKGLHSTETANVEKAAKVLQRLITWFPWAKSFITPEIQEGIRIAVLVPKPENPKKGTWNEVVLQTLRVAIDAHPVEILFTQNAGLKNILDFNPDVFGDTFLKTLVMRERTGLLPKRRRYSEEGDLVRIIRAYYERKLSGKKGTLLDLVGEKLYALERATINIPPEINQEKDQRKARQLLTAPTDPYCSRLLQQLYLKYGRE
jgi:hypothetical protein